MELLNRLKQLNKTQKIITISLVVLLILILVAYWIIYPYYSNKIERQEKPEDLGISLEVELPNIEDDTDLKDIEDSLNRTEDKIYTEEQKEDEIINILLCGMDARSYESVSRSDTIILASYNKTQHSVKLVSFMRDSWVYLPERGWSRINAATVYGGTGLLINTINYNFDLDIQDYIQIKFDDFKKVIDILGGIDVELTKQEINYINGKLHTEDKDWSNDIKAETGIVHLNGAQALWHCRNRTIGNSDFERTERQREVLSILIDKATSMTLGQATRLIFELREHVNTNIDMQTISLLAYDALISGNITVESARVPFDEAYSFSNKNGASVLALDMEKNTELLHEFLGYETEEEEESIEGSVDDTESVEGTEDTEGTSKSSNINTMA